MNLTICVNLCTKILIIGEVFISLLPGFPVSSPPPDRSMGKHFHGALFSSRFGKECFSKQDLSPGFLSVPMESINGLASHRFFLEDQFCAGQFKDFVCPGETHFILEALCEPERLREADLLLGSVV